MTKLCLVFIFTFLLCFVFLSAKTHGDVLRTKNQERYFGMVISKTEDEVRFQIRKPNGDTEVQSFSRSQLEEVVETLDRSELLAISELDDLEMFELCEQLASISSDLEAQWQFNHLAQELKRRNPSQELEVALRRLIVQASNGKLAWNVLAEELLGSPDRATGNGPTIDWVNFDWQMTTIHRMDTSERFLLKELLLTQRQGGDWQVQWERLQNRIKNWCSVAVLRRLESELNVAAKDGLSRDLLRLELLIDDIESALQGTPSWPRN